MLSVDSEGNKSDVSVMQNFYNRDGASSHSNGARSDAVDSAENGELPAGSEVVNFPDFVRVLAHFKPLKKNAEKNKLNSREEKLRCELIARNIDIPL